jgi:hypothetical protein
VRTGVKLKYWFLRHYWWILGAALIASIVFLVHRDEQLGTGATVVGALLSLAYFVQKQKLEELRLFRELFKEFNDRYDQMNEKLALIVEGPETELTQDERQLLVDYFNLCGEEYLYFIKGYVDPMVWAAWYNGMTAIVSTPRIQKLWHTEKRTGSYYGLPL